MPEAPPAAALPLTVPLRPYGFMTLPTVERELGHEVSVLNDATKEGNRSIEELKRQSATERLREATAEASKIVSEAQNDVNYSRP